MRIKPLVFGLARDLWKKACDLGFVGMFIDEEYGGAGVGLMEVALVFEEFSR